MVIDPKRREMFVDLYRIAEQYEKPPFKDGDIEGNAAWFDNATKKYMEPFIRKYNDDQLAADLIFAILDDASRQAVKANNAVGKA